MRSLMDVSDFTVKELYDLMDCAIDIMENPDRYSEVCKGKKLATLFFEPSTRTRLSFEAAMLELGGNVLGFSEAGSSSAAKGETVADTAKVISCYADIIAMRHPMEGAPLVASLNASVPVINAGDGGHKHPTQTLADILTIYKSKGRLDNLKIGICGDLKYGRTVHSLISAMLRYENVEFILISPEELSLPQYLKDKMDNKSANYKEVTSLEDSIEELDILYMTRIQRERFDDKNEYERLKDTYVLDVPKLNNAPEDMIVLHPLPRVNEISVDVDSDPRAKYFEEALCGKYMRMALIIKLLNDGDKSVNMDQYSNGYINKPIEKPEFITCKNHKCITTVERGLKQKSIVDNSNVTRCYYCEKEL